MTIAMTVMPTAKPIRARRKIALTINCRTGEAGCCKSVANTQAKNIYKASSPASIKYSGQWNRTPSGDRTHPACLDFSWDRPHPACLDFSWDRTHPACVDFIANSIDSWSPHPRRLLPFFEPAPNVIRIEELLHRRSNL